MLNSKFFTVMIVLSFLLVGAALTFQAIDFHEYGLIEKYIGK